MGMDTYMGSGDVTCHFSKYRTQGYLLGYDMRQLYRRHAHTNTLPLRTCIVMISHTSHEHGFYKSVEFNSVIISTHYNKWHGKR